MLQQKNKEVREEVKKESKPPVKKQDRSKQVEKKKNLTLKIVIIGIVVIILGNVLFFTQRNSNEGGLEIMEGEDGTQYTIEPGKLVASGLPQDGIPAITVPEFVSVAESSWVSDEDYVLVLEYGGVTRVYPVHIMLWHEIVNDAIGEEEILITYCPLCFSGKAYLRDDTFGTSGKVYNSNGVMYDSTTQTLWSQFDGIGIVGENAGERLEALPLSLVAWGEFKEAHPESEVLSKNTGFRRPYGTDPYIGYYTDDSLFFPVERQSDLLPKKEIIVGIEMKEAYKAYPISVLKEQGTIKDTLGGVSITLEYMPDGQIKVTESKSGNQIVHTTSFWFVWYAFHPDTTVYGL